MATISVSRSRVKGGTPVFGAAVEYGVPEGITYMSDYVQQLIVDLGGPLSQSQVDGLWGPISADALKQTAKKYGYLHYPRQYGDYYSSSYTNGKKKVLVRPGQLIPNLSQKRKELQEAAQQQPQQQEMNTECSNGIKIIQQYGPQLDAAIIQVTQIANNYYTNPSPANKASLETAINTWQNQMSPAFDKVIATVAGCGRTDLSQPFQAKKQQLDAAVAQGKVILQGPTAPVQNKEMCAAIMGQVDIMYATVGNTAATIRGLADSRDTDTTFQIVPNAPGITLPYLIANWPNVKTALSTAEGQINSQCDVAGYGEKIRVIRETLEDAILYAQDKLQEPIQPEPVPQPEPQPEPQPQPQPVPPGPQPVPQPVPGPVPAPKPLPGNVPLILGGTALGLGALTLFMVMRRKRPSPGTACYNCY